MKKISLSLIKKILYCVIVLSCLTVAMISTFQILPKDNTIELNQGGSVNNNSTTTSNGEETPPADDDGIVNLSQICPVCQKCLDVNCTEESHEEKCGNGLQKYTFEATESELTDGIGSTNVTVSSSNGMSYVKNLNNNLGASVNFKVKASEQTTASLFVVISLRKADTVFTDTMSVLVNAQNYSSPTIIPKTQSGNDEWSNFKAFNLGCISLNKGINELSFVVSKSGNLSGYNFAKIELACGVLLDVGHQDCETCGKCLEPDCAMHEKCGEFTGAVARYEAEDAALAGGPSVHSSGTLVQNINKKQGATITYTVNAAEAGNYYLVVALTQKKTKGLVTDAFNITVNGTQLTSTATIKATATGGNDWTNSVEILIGHIKLNQGNNTVVFTVATTNDVCPNMDYIVIKQDHQECAVCGKCLTVDCEEHENCGDDLQVVATYQAEDALLTGGATVNDAGTMVEGLNGNLGACVAYTVNVGMTGDYYLLVALTYKGAKGLVADAFHIAVNGVDYSTQATIKASQTNGDDTTTSAEIKLGHVTLHKGENSITFTVATTDDVVPNMDYVVIQKDTFSTVLEAENAILRGVAVVKENSCADMKANKGQSGITFKVNTNKPYTVKLVLHITKRKNAFNLQDAVSLKINGVSATFEAVSPANGTDAWASFIPIELGEFELQSGKNTIDIDFLTTNADYNFSIDKLEISNV